MKYTTLSQHETGTCAALQNSSLWALSMELLEVDYSTWQFQLLIITTLLLRLYDGSFSDAGSFSMRGSVT